MQQEFNFKKRLGGFFVKNDCDVFVENTEENKSIGFEKFDWQNKWTDSKGNVLGKRLDMIVFHGGNLKDMADPFGIELKAGGLISDTYQALKQLTEYRDIEYNIPIRNWKGKLSAIGYINEFAFDRGHLMEYWNGGVTNTTTASNENMDFIIGGFFIKFGFFIARKDFGDKLEIRFHNKKYYLPQYSEAKL